jgi:nucleoside-diphosphate-sugar epimerase
MAKRIFIIGSQGYLGSRLSDYLQDYGYDCVGIDIGFFQYGVLNNPRAVNTLNKDAKALNENDLQGFDVVLQLAGISNDPFGNLKPEVIYDPTRKYAVEIARMCKKLGVRYIFPSSCSVYGIGDGLLDENGPVNPQTPYSLNKLQIEQDLAELADSTFSPIALRLATVFGSSPRIRFDVVINMLCGMAVAQKQVVLNSDGQAWRPHLFIDDVFEAFRCCIEWDYKESKLMVLNVGRNDNNWKILDVARLIQSKVAGCELKFLGNSSTDESVALVKDRKIQDGVDKRTYCVSFDRIHTILPGFEAKWDIEKGIDQLLNDLKHWELNEVKFKQREFYRLQQIEHLHKTNQINDQLVFQ